MPSISQQLWTIYKLLKHLKASSILRNTNKQKRYRENKHRWEQEKERKGASIILNKSLGGESHLEDSST